jgi:hypothetical protein
MQEDLRKEAEEMAALEEAIKNAREAEALKILRMLNKAIEQGKDIKQFADELDSYVEGKT